MRRHPCGWPKPRRGRSQSPSVRSPDRGTAKQIDDAVQGALASGILEVHSLGWAFEPSGYVRFFTGLFAATLALAALLSVKHLEAERVRPAEFYTLLLLATTGMMLAASAADLLIVCDNRASGSAPDKGSSVNPRDPANISYRH